MPTSSPTDEQVQRAKDAYDIWARETQWRPAKTQPFDALPHHVRRAWIVMVEAMYQRGRVDEQFNMG